MSEPAAREELGFRRTACACAFCAAYCRHLPGTLNPSDLGRLCPPGADLFAWAERHLRAQTDKPYPALVPARQADGSCHWHFAGRCAVHENAPFGCAFFDAHQDDAEVGRRAAAAVRAIREDADADGPYVRVWRHLRRLGLTAPPGDRDGLAAELLAVRRRAQRGRRRAAGEGRS